MSYATQSIEAEKEVEDTPRSGEAIQTDRDRKALADALRQTAPFGNKGREAYAEVEEGDAGEQGRYRENDADVAVRAVNDTEACGIKFASGKQCASTKAL